MASMMTPLAAGLYALLAFYLGGWWLGRWAGNFSLLLFLMSAATLLFWLAERFHFRPAREAAARRRRAALTHGPRGRYGNCFAESRGDGFERLLRGDDHHRQDQEGQSQSGREDAAARSDAVDEEAERQATATSCGTERSRVRLRAISPTIFSAFFSPHFSNKKTA